VDPPSRGANIAPAGAEFLTGGPYGCSAAKRGRDRTKYRGNVMVNCVRHSGTKRSRAKGHAYFVTDLPERRDAHDQGFPRRLLRMVAAGRQTGGRDSS